MERIYYIVYYDDLKKTLLRKVSPAAITKAKYVSKVLTEIGYEVQIISPALPNTNGYFDSSNEYIAQNIKLKLFASRYSRFKPLRLIRRIYSTIKFIIYLFHKIPKHSTIIVYHSLSYLKTISVLNKIKKFNLIYEVNELYGDVKNNKTITKKEIKYVQKANAFIFPTTELDSLLNKHKKPFVINYGNYEIKTRYGKKFNDGKIHCVYSGTLSADKGVAIAAEASLYLNSNYHIHILGFGSKKRRKT
jgi:hypothetical protein